MSAAILTFVNRELTREEQKRIVQQWKDATDALLAQKMHELQALTDEEAVHIADMLLSMALNVYRDPRRETYSGLVEQQRILSRFNQQAA